MLFSERQASFIKITTFVFSEKDVWELQWKRINLWKNMTLEELWGLFPIVLVPHNHKWTDWAKQEIELLSALLASYNPIISHISSTAIPNIQAKPIVDILVEVSADADWQPIKDIMEANDISVCQNLKSASVSTKDILWKDMPTRFSIFISTELKIIMKSFFVIILWNIPI